MYIRKLGYLLGIWPRPGPPDTPELCDSKIGHQATVLTSLHPPHLLAYRTSPLFLWRIHTPFSFPFRQEHTPLFSLSFLLSSPRLSPVSPNSPPTSPPIFHRIIWVLVSFFPLNIHYPVPALCLNNVPLLFFLSLAISYPSLLSPLFPQVRQSLHFPVAYVATISSSVPRFHDSI
jgi:hypothetical protein